MPSCKPVLQSDLATVLCGDLFAGFAPAHHLLSAEALATYAQGNPGCCLHHTGEPGYQAIGLAWVPA